VCARGSASPVVAAAAAIAITIAVSACGKKPACVVAHPTVPGGAFLWKAQRDGGPVVWLFGTIHNGATTSVPAAAWAALDGAPRLVSELGDLEPDPAQLREVTVLPRGKGLDQLLPAEDWYDLRDALRGVIREADLARARPWFAMSRLSATTAASPSPTMDEALARRANDRGLPIDHLETWDAQLSALVDAVSIADLQEAIHARRTMRCELAQMRASYEGGDTAAMQQILAARDAEHLLWARNRAWLPQLEQLATAGGGFVAVGLGHMFGEGGLPALLAAAGFAVERVP